MNRSGVKLDLVLEAARRVSNAELDLRVQVADARRHGATWDSIGAALNITRQAAQQRFSREPDAAVRTRT
jgi:hypothetical protein